MTFEADPPSFLLGDIDIPPITCSLTDYDWVMNLPEITKSASDTVEVSLKGGSAEADMFALSDDVS